MKIMFKSFFSASSALRCSGVVGVEFLNCGSVMFAFVLLGVFLYCPLPITSSHGCRWGLSLCYSPSGLSWDRNSIFVALGV